MPAVICACGKKQGPAPALVIVLALLVIGWMLTSVTLAEWAALGVELAIAAVIFVFRRW